MIFGLVFQRFTSNSKDWSSIPKVVGSIPTVAGHIFQARPVWICTQSNITNIIFHSGYTNKYKLYRNKILTLTRVSKKLYYHTYFEQNANNLKNTWKNTWKGINIIINRNKKNIKQITALRKPNNVGISYNTSEIPDIMNNHFATIANNLSSKIQQPSTS